MGRPTEEKKERMVKLRLNNEMYEWLMTQGDNVSATIRGLIREGMERKYERQDLMDRAVEREMCRQAKTFGLSSHDLFRGLSELIRKGYIYIELGRLRTHGNLKTRELEIECYKRKLKPQDVVDMLVRRIKI